MFKFSLHIEITREEICPHRKCYCILKKRIGIVYVLRKGNLQIKVTIEDVRPPVSEDPLARFIQESMDVISHSLEKCIDDACIERPDCDHEDNPRDPPVNTNGN